MTVEEKNQLDSENVFDFKDPRLRHLNKSFKREELQVSFIDFGSNKDSVPRAIDEIIKFNCMTLEFNYIQDLFTQLHSLAIEKTGNLDWAGLFSIFDHNHDNLLDKNELRAMIKECKETFAEVTEAEVAFAFNVMSFFQKFLKKTVFLEWVQSMLGRSKKQLIYYS